MISFANVSKQYGKQILFVDASFQLNPGEKAGLVGPNGAGKTTVAFALHVLAATDQEHLLIIAPKAVAVDLTEAQVISNGEKKTIADLDLEGVAMYNLVRGPEAGKLFHDKGRGNGYILTIGGKRIYIAGDTECTPEMKALTGIDVAFIPMNLPYTMPPAEAAECVVAFHPAVVYPFHYGESDVAEFAKGVEPAGIEVRQRNWYPNGMPF